MDILLCPYKIIHCYFYCGKIPPGYARIKTGLIDDVRAMAGFFRSKNNNGYFVVSLQNYPGIQNTIGTLVQDEILKWLYEQ